MPRDSLKIGAPDPVTGPESGAPNVNYAFPVSGSRFGLGAVTYSAEFGDGTISTWGRSPFGKTWLATAAYDVRAQAHCVDFPEVI